MPSACCASTPTGPTSWPTAACPSSAQTSGRRTRRRSSAGSAVPVQREPVAPLAAGRGIDDEVLDLVIARREGAGDVDVLVAVAALVARDLAGATPRPREAARRGSAGI